MKVRVLMSSGDEDEWENVGDAVISEQFMLTVVGPAETVEVEGEPEQMMSVRARYAPGMWMRIEYEE